MEIKEQKLRTEKMLVSQLHQMGYSNVTTKNLTKSGKHTNDLLMLIERDVEGLTSLLDEVAKALREEIKSSSR